MPLEMLEQPKATPGLEINAQSRPIDSLTPGKPAHAKLLKHLTDQIKFSEREMSNFHDRWQINEMKMQAYIDLPSAEKALKAISENGQPPQPTNLVIPFGYAAQQTITSYLMHTFSSRPDFFPVSTLDPQRVKQAKNMQAVLNYQMLHTRAVRHLWQYFNDIGTYGVGIFSCDWAVDERYKTVREKQPAFAGVQPAAPVDTVYRELQTMYEGNMISSVDPYTWFPDPRVPMSECSAEGEFCYRRKYVALFKLKKAEAQGIYSNIGLIEANSRSIENGDPSSRNKQWGMRGTAGANSTISSGTSNSKGFPQIDYGTVELIPKDFGLSESSEVEKWQFTIANDSVIIQAEPFESDHGRHPYEATEPHGVGYGFGQPGSMDYISPLQDLMSWLVNSHIENVRSVINNTLVFDPNAIEEADLADQGPGGRYRLKRGARGRDIRTFIHQLEVVDVTKGHIKDMQMFMQLAHMLLGINPTVMGQAESGGRETARGVGARTGAAHGRLSTLAQVISSQGFTPLAEQMVMNNQQYLSETFYGMMLGSAADAGPLILEPGDVTGDFTFPTHDGTMPYDKQFKMQVWREILEGVHQSPVLMQTYDIPKLFERGAKEADVLDIETFRLPQQEGLPQAANVELSPDEEVMKQVQAGNLAAIPGGMGR